MPRQHSLSLALLTDLEAGLELAAHAIDSGAALEKLRRLQAFHGIATANTTGPIDHSHLFTDPQAQHNGMMLEHYHPTAGPRRLLGIPLRLSEAPVDIYLPAPALGELYGSGAYRVRLLSVANRRAPA